MDRSIQERERLERLRERQRISRLEEEANERRLDNEWDLDTTTDEVGLKAHALLKWLDENNDASILTPMEAAELSNLKVRLSELEDSKEDVINAGQDPSEIDVEIVNIESEIEELEGKIDVYNIIPSGSFYDMTEFEVINADLGDRRYVVGDADEMQSSAEEYVEQLIDDIGYGGFNRGFAES